MKIVELIVVRVYRKTSNICKEKIVELKMIRGIG